MERRAAIQGLVGLALPALAGVACGSGSKQECSTAAGGTASQSGAGAAGEGGSGPHATDPDVAATDVWVLGHPDHGKTTLVAAMLHALAAEGQAAAIELDALNEGESTEVLGLPITRAAAAFSFAERSYVAMDFPTPSDSAKALIAGATPNNAAILVVSLQDGAMTVTREHLELCRDAGVTTLVTFMSKLDLVDDVDIVELVELELRELMAKFGFKNVPLVRGNGLLALTSSPDSEANSWVGELLSALSSELNTRKDPGTFQGHVSSFPAHIYVATQADGGQGIAIPPGAALSIAVDTATFGVTISPEVPSQALEPGAHAVVRIQADEALDVSVGTRFSIVAEGELVGIGMVSQL